MLDVKGDVVNIGDEVWVAQRGNVLDKAVFTKETKYSFIVKCYGARVGYSIPKYVHRVNPNYSYGDPRQTRHIQVDISQEPCTRIIKV